MFDYDFSHRLDHSLDQEDDFPLDCPACFGEGQLVDFWGPMVCATCKGTGIMFHSAWLAHVQTFPAHTQQHMLRHQPPAWRKLNGR